MRCIRSALRIIDEYCVATSNEVAIDLRTYKMMSIECHKVGCWPRPAKLKKYLYGHENTTSLAYLCCCIVWCLCVGFLFNIRVLYTRLLNYKNTDCCEQKTISKRLALGFSERAYHVIPKGFNSEQDYSWVVFPWVEVPTRIKYKVNILKYARLSDFFIVFFMANFSILRFFFINPRWILQTYTAYDWFLSRILLERIHGDYIIAEHYDRWAVLADQVINVRRTEMENTGKLTLMQHGLVCSITKHLFELNLPYKMKSIERLIVYDQQSRDIFFKDIIDSRFIPCDVRFSLPSISLLDWPNDSFSILIVGHAICDKYHVELYEKINKSVLFNRVKVYYKPHPTVKASLSLSKLDWEVIDSEIYPRVNLLVSYPSTLVYEYMQSGVKCIVHSIDETEFDYVLNLIQSSYTEQEIKND